MWSQNKLCFFGNNTLSITYFNRTIVEIRVHPPGSASANHCTMLPNLSSKIDELTFWLVFDICKVNHNKTQLSKQRRYLCKSITMQKMLINCCHTYNYLYLEISLGKSAYTISISQVSKKISAHSWTLNWWRTFGYWSMVKTTDKLQCLH